jgi:hypothetical protein
MSWGLKAVDLRGSSATGTRAQHIPTYHTRTVPGEEACTACIAAGAGHIIRVGDTRLEIGI